MNIQTLSKNIDFIKAQEKPLSADIGIIKGNKYTYLFDVGNSTESLEKIKTYTNTKIIISHFHTDHFGNINKLDFNELFLGKNTANYYKENNKNVTVVKKAISINDGIKICIFPIPSSHAKGSLGATVENEYTFLGDAAYSTVKNDKIVYNAQLLYEQIELLKNINTKYFLLSHRSPFQITKEDLINELLSIYNGWNKNSPYIELE